MNTSGLLQSEAEHLNAKHGLKGFITFVMGKNNFTKAVIKNPIAHSSLEVYLHGAHITSWQTKEGEHLFLSEKSLFEKEKAIRGGIPLCFPQFANGPLQAHGFARNSLWDVVETGIDQAKSSVTLVLQLKESKYTLDMWPHPFTATLRVSLSPSSLKVEFSAENTGEEAFAFQLAMHSYFTATDIKNVSVTGLKGTEYVDKVDNGEKKRENNQSVTFAGEVDRIYASVKDTVAIVDKGNECTLRIDRQGLPDVIVWNPWVNKARGMADLGEDNYPKFVCVEVGVVNEPVKLEPGQKHTVSQMLVPPTADASL